MKGLIIFLTGVLVGAVVLMVWACLIVGAEADERDRQMFEKYIKETEHEQKTSD